MAEVFGDLRTRGTALHFASFALGFFTVLGIGLSFDGQVEPDVSFHLAIARDYAANGFRPSAYSTDIAEGALAAHPADRELLFHLLMAAFLKAGLSESMTSRLLPALAAGAIATALWYHSRSLLVVLCGAFATNTFLFRLLMCRPHGFAIACVLLATAYLVRGRYRAAAAVNFIYTLSYSVPVLIGLAALLEAMATRKARGLLLVAATSALGLCVHPHFPHNVALLWYQGFEVMRNALLGNPLEVAVPDELRPFAPAQFLLDSWLPIVLFVVVIVRRGAPWWVVALQAVLLALTLRSMRFIEYWAPLVALTARPAVEYLVPRKPPALRWLMVALFLLARPVTGVVAAGMKAKEVTGEGSTYSGAAAWLGENAGGESVFNEDFGAYPELRHEGVGLRVIQGLDPIFLAAYDPARQEEMKAAVKGELSLEEFRRRFSYRYVLTRKGRPLSEEGFHEGGIVYEDRHAVVVDTGPR